jgi:hypothetical protein
LDSRGSRTCSDSCDARRVCWGVSSGSSGVAGTQDTSRLMMLSEDEVGALLSCCETTASAPTRRATSTRNGFIAWRGVPRGLGFVLA